MDNGRKCNWYRIMITDDKKLINGKKGVRTLRAERLSVGELSIITMISNLEIVNSLWAPISMPFNHEAITTLGQYYCRNIYMYYSSRLVLCEIIVNLLYLIQYLIHDYTLYLNLVSFSLWHWNIILLFCLRNCKGLLNIAVP